LVSVVTEVFVEIFHVKDEDTVISDDKRVDLDGMALGGKTGARHKTAAGPAEPVQADTSERIQ
jgi:hypothetical protein